MYSIQNDDWEEGHSPLPLHASMQLPGLHTDTVQVLLWDFP